MNKLIFISSFKQ